MTRIKTSAAPAQLADTEAFVYFTHKMRPEFHDWLHGLAERLGLPLSNTIDTALMRLATEAGVASPPPRLPHRRRRKRTV